MGQPRRKVQISQADLGTLNQLEINLIDAIRNRFRFGEITIVTHDGIPRKITRFTEIDTLD